MEVAERDTENEGQIITMRCYIVAASAKWDFPEIAEFLNSCKK